MKFATGPDRRSSLDGLDEPPTGAAARNLSRRIILAILALPSIWLMLAAPARSQSDPPRSQSPSPDLSSKSLEDLMNTEVTSVSKKEQKLSQVAAAIFVISAEDIRRSGATNIPDLLRMVPGLDVGQINGSTWAISARGFNAQFSNKLLVMIDGRVVYTPNFAGVYWDTLDFPLEDIERIEVIRGPGGTVWGANAVNGVISIFTKTAAETRGGVVQAGAGNIQQGFGLAQYGGGWKNAVDYRVYAKYFNQYHLSSLSGQNGFDDWHMLRGGFRVDSTLSPKDTLMLEGSLYTGREDELGFVLPAVTPAFHTPEINPHRHGHLRRRAHPRRQRSRRIRPLRLPPRNGPRAGNSGANYQFQ